MYSAFQAHYCGEEFFAPYDVVLTKTDVVQPDVIFITKERKGVIRERGVFATSDLVVEILSCRTPSGIWT